jgi:molybdopterin-guanine dinucleotide biosynthesis protein B
MKSFSIVGWSGSGKTLLITRLIEEFRAKGKKVVAVKSAHAGYALQPEGKDTARFLQAGAREAYLLAGSELLRMTPLAAPAELLAELRQRLGAGDVVLLEGLTAPDIPVIEVQDPRVEMTLKTLPENLAALVTTAKNACPCPCFHPDDVAAIRAFIEEHHE